jgi:hypothetical protein
MISAEKDVHRHPPVFTAADYIHDGKQHLLLSASGSVGTIKYEIS